MPVYNSRDYNVKIKVPKQDKKTRIIVKNPAPDLDFERAIMDFEVEHEVEEGKWELRTVFDPSIELKVGYDNGDDEEKWYLEYLNPKTFEYVDFRQNYAYLKRNGRLFTGKGKNKHVVVYLDTWGDPNVGWGG